MIKQTTCPNCKINLLIHSRTSIFKCPDCRTETLIRVTQSPRVEEATKIITPEKVKA